MTMANLNPEEKIKRDDKMAEVDEYIGARQQIRDRLTENYEADIARLDAEIAEHTLIRNGLAQLK